jgi:hypothetical protein
MKQSGSLPVLVSRVKSRYWLTPRFLAFLSGPITNSSGTGIDI